MESICTLWTKYLNKAATQEEVISLIQEWLLQQEKDLVPNKVNIVSLFPDGLSFIHVNQTFYQDNKQPYRNLNFTLTPSPSRYKGILNINPNSFVIDSEASELIKSLDRMSLNYINRCVLEIPNTKSRKIYKVNWDEETKELKIRKGDRVVISTSESYEKTITSCDAERNINVLPEYDLIIYPGQDLELILGFGTHHFTSRKRKDIYLKVTVI